ncbi:MAG: PQQ-binding-like beta-propeller repeat protein [Pirellulales bacterium]
MPLDGGHVESYKLVRERVLDHVPDRYSGTGAAIQPPLAVGNRVLWTSTNGYVYSRELTKELIQFRFRMDDDGASAPVYITPFVFSASRSGTIYCLDEVSGLDIWQLRAGQSISQPLIAVDGALYAVTETGEMMRVDPLAGRQLWYTTGVQSFLAASAKRLYVSDNLGRLAVLDASGGGRLAALPVPGFDELQIRNTSSDRIYLGTTTGLIQCLREVTQPKPLEHTAGFAIAPKPKDGAAPAAAPADGSAPPADAASPFGTPAAPATPAEPAAPAAANPFGS